MYPKQDISYDDFYNTNKQYLSYTGKGKNVLKLAAKVKSALITFCLTFLIHICVARIYVYYTNLIKSMIIVHKIESMGFRSLNDSIQN